MHLRRVVLSALLIASVMGGMLVLPASAASPPNASATIFPQGFNLSTLETQLNQQGLDLSALTNLLQQVGVSSGQVSSNASTVFGNIFGGNSGGLSNTLLAKAQPDACFKVTGTSGLQITSVSDTPIPQSGVCPDGTKPKTDQSYVWGLTQSGNDLWFGTAANTQCLVEGSYLQTALPSVNSNAACEFGVIGNPESTLGKLGDWRAPQIYYYNLVTKHITLAGAGNTAVTNALDNTLGLRSAGALNGVVFLAGPALQGGGINVFAFNTSTHAFIGVQNFSLYDNIRKWLVNGSQLYTAVHTANGAGSILRWTGTVSNPFQFDQVGTVNGDPAELAVFNNQLFISTWPDPVALAGLLQNPSSINLQNLPVAGLWMSPTIPANGILPHSTSDWQEPWNVLDYEPDPVTALTYGGGAIMAYNGFLYWGTMHVPALSALLHYAVYGSGILPNPTNLLDTLALEQHSERAISIFRGTFYGGFHMTQLLYGETTLPTWVPSSLTTLQAGGQWVNLPTKAGPPLYGHSGFGNPYNNYTWTMAVYKGALYVGTMDWSILVGQQLGVNVDPAGYGADLWKFTSSYAPAVAVSTTGVGNPFNYGVRTMITSSDGSALYLGMANPMNLAQDANGQPVGGWELRQLK